MLTEVILQRCVREKLANIGCLSEFLLVLDFLFLNHVGEVKYGIDDIEHCDRNKDFVNRSGS